jgi:hypothetical protein
MGRAQFVAIIVSDVAREWLPIGRPLFGSPVHPMADDDYDGDEQSRDFARGYAFGVDLYPAPLRDELAASDPQRFDALVDALLADWEAHQQHGLLKQLETSLPWVSLIDWCVSLTTPPPSMLSQPRRYTAPHRSTRPHHGRESRLSEMPAALEALERTPFARARSWHEPSLGETPTRPTNKSLTRAGLAPLHLYQ